MNVIGGLAISKWYLQMMPRIIEDSGGCKNQEGTAAEKYQVYSLLDRDLLCKSQNWINRNTIRWQVKRLPYMYLTCVFSGLPGVVFLCG